MLVATFKEGTAWAGRTITFADGRFDLAGFGPVPPQALLDYDSQQQLAWAYDGLRQWVQQAAVAVPLSGTSGWSGGAAGSPGYAAGTVATSAGAAASGATPERPHKPFPVWAIVLVVVACLVPLLAIFAAIAIPVFVAGDLLHATKPLLASAGGSTIKTGLETWALNHDGTYPDPAEVAGDGALGASMSSWPTNPFTGYPMAQGTGPGEFTYTLSDDARLFKLTVYGENGKVLTTIYSQGWPQVGAPVPGPRSC